MFFIKPFNLWQAEGDQDKVPLWLLSTVLSVEKLYIFMYYFVILLIFYISFSSFGAP